MKAAKQSTGTKRCAQSKDCGSELLLAWDYCYHHVRRAAGVQVEFDWVAAGVNSGRDERWAYKVIYDLKRRMRK